MINKLSDFCDKQAPKKCPKSTNAERCRRYRQTMILIDQKFRERERKRQKLVRLQRSPAQKEIDRQKAKERMRIYRKNKKEKIKEDNSKAKPLMTRKQTEMQRVKWREDKRKYRAGLSSQKKRRIRERENLQRQKNKTQPEQNFKKCNKTISEDQGYCSFEASRKAIYRAKVKLPFHPKKYATVVEGLIKTASPRKRKAIEEKIEVLTPKKKKRLTFLEETVNNIKTIYTNLKKSRSRKDENRRRLMGNQLKRLKKLRLMKSASDELGIRYKSLLKWSKLETTACESRVKRSDAMTDEVILRIKDFYVSPESSVTHAGKKTVLKKTMMQKQTLNETLEETYKKFTEKHPTTKVSFSKFVALKPKHVEPSIKRQFRGCLCEKCTNVELQLKAVNNHLDKNDRIGNKYTANNMTLCHQKDENSNSIHALSPKCIQRQCEECGTKKMSEYLNSHKKDDISEDCCWYQWETTLLPQNGSTSTGIKPKRKMLVKHSGTLNQLIQSFCESLEQFSIHLFEAIWQHEQFNEAKKNIHEGEVICVLDFAENLTLKNQNECQSAHWYSQQVTIHPIVAYYLVSQEEELDEKKMITHEMVYISNDLVHDSHTVKHFVSCMIKTLKKELGEQGITKIIQFTDGCSAQYKSKRPFLDISEAKIQTERNFFGSGHGKGPSDGCSGVVKAAVTRALKGGEVLNSAEDVFNFVSKKLKKSDRNFKRSFYFCKSNDIERTDQAKSTNLVTVKGTRQLHAVKGIRSGVIECRKLSCFCKYCKYNIGECPNKEFVDAWEVKTLITGTRNSSKTQKKKVMNFDPQNTEDTNNKSKLETTDTTHQQTNAYVKTYDQHTSKQTTSINADDDTQKNTHQPAKCPLSWNAIRLVRSKTYEDLKDRIQNEFLDPVLRKEELASNIWILGRNIDELSKKILPNIDDIYRTNLDLYPVEVMADGNCLPRTASVLAFGTEARHQEMRKRIVVEMVINEEKYLKLAHLATGRSRERLVNSFTMYSDFYIPGTKVNTQISKKIYRQEVMEILKSGTYMGIWQICALATVLNAPVASVYPEKGSMVVRKDLHRLIQPLTQDNENIRKPFFLMWTTTREDMLNKNWIPNHFVPLLHAHAPIETNIMKLFDDEETEGDVVDLSDVICKLEDDQDQLIINTTGYGIDEQNTFTFCLDDLMKSKDFLQCDDEQFIDLDKLEEIKIVDGKVVDNKLVDDEFVHGKMVDDIKVNCRMVDDKMVNGRVDDDKMVDGKVDDLMVDGKVDDKMANHKMEDDIMVDGKVDDDIMVDGKFVDDMMVDSRVGDDIMVDGKLVDDKMGDGSVDNDKLVDGSVDDDKLVNGSVDDDKILDGKSVDEKMVDDMMVDSRVGDDIMVDKKLVDGSVDDDKLASDMMVDGKVDVDKMVDSKLVRDMIVVVDKLVDSKMVDDTNEKADIEKFRVDMLVDDNMVYDKMVDGRVDDDKVVDGKVDDDKMVDSKLDLDMIVVVDKLVDGKMVDDTNEKAHIEKFRVDMLVDDNMIYDKMVDGRVDDDKMVDGKVDDDKMVDSKLGSDMIVVVDKLVDGKMVDDTNEKADIEKFRVDMLVDDNMVYDKMVDGRVDGDKVVDGKVDDKMVDSKLGRDMIVDKLVDGKMVDDTNEKADIEKFRIDVGHYIIVKHGGVSLPAVVTAMYNDSYVWAQFYKKVNRRWSHQPKEFLVSKIDFVRHLESPDLIWSGGSRVYYHFSDFV